MLTSDWVVGFTDGEGSFRIKIQTAKSDKARFMPFYVSLRFSISQAEKSMVEQIQSFFGLGKVRENLTHRGNYEFEVSRLKEIIMIRGFFRTHPLQTTKQQLRYQQWSKALDIILANQHLTEKGLLRIAKLREGMITAKSKSRLGKLTYRYDMMVKTITSFFSFDDKRNWTTEDIEFLKRNFPSKQTLEIASILNHSYQSVIQMARLLQLKKNTRLFAKNLWRPEEIIFLTENYSKLSKREIADNLKRPISSVYFKGKELGMAKALV